MDPSPDRYTTTLAHFLGRFLQAHAYGTEPTDDDVTCAIGILLRVDSLPELPRDEYEERIAAIRRDLEEADRA